MNKTTKKIAYAAMFAVINYVAFTYGKISIPVVGGTSTAIHIANAVVVLSSWILGPIYGGLAGAVGLSIADVLDPRYITSAPKTFILKFLIGFIAGTIAEKMKLSEQTERKDIIRITLISAAAGLGFNVIFDPIFGYFYRNLVLGISSEIASVIATWVAGATAINAVICTIVAVLLYQSLYKSIPKL